MTETFSVLIAIGIVIIFVVICVLCSMYLIKNKIYQSDVDEHFGKLLDKEAKILKEFAKDEKDRLANYGYKEYELSELRKEANARYLKSKATVKISEISEEFYKSYPEYSNVNVKYAIMKIINASNNIDNKLFKKPTLKKVGKTFHINIKTALAMRQVLPTINHNRQKDVYSRIVLNNIIWITIELLTKKIVPEKDKYLWDDSSSDMIGKW